MKILLASSEVHPYSKTGGLADMASALAKFLGRAGQQVGLVTPLYRGIRERFPHLQKFEGNLDLPLGDHRIPADVWTLEPSKGVTLYFIAVPGFFDRTGLYNEHEYDYADNPQRFIYFSKAIAHLARQLSWQPQIVHVHDWQAGLVPLLIHHQRNQDGWQNAPKTCFTIHNLAYQGNFPLGAYGFTNLPATYLHWNAAEFYSQFSLMKTGIVFADALTTVSPRYAVEITTPQFGVGMDGVLRERQQSLVGILNGVDYEEWNTESNVYLKHSFALHNLDGKTAEKLDLQRELGLPVNADVPLFATVGRLAEQKGIAIMLGALAEMLAANMQFALLGTGQSEYVNGFRELALRFPGKVALQLTFDEGLSHRIEAGADFCVMPSLFEPCGLNQMYSLRYGTVPIVRRTGGLDDSVIDIREDEQKANGIKFDEYSPRALAKAIRKALALYEDKPLLLHYRQNGMPADFSWQRSVEQYLKIYERLLQ